VPVISTSQLFVIRLHPNTPVNLECEYFGIPNPTLSWKRNSNILTNGSNGTVIYLQGNVSLLIVMDRFGKSGGNFVCNASNIAGDIHLNFSILCKFLVNDDTTVESR